MDYETPDGSQFSVREVFLPQTPGKDDEPAFAYTTVSAIVDGKAFFGRLERRVECVDEADVLSSLLPVPAEAIHPPFREGLTHAPAIDPGKHYLKAPSFTWDDCQPGQTLVADCVLNEVQMLEELHSYRHPNIVSYHGCVLHNARIAHICLERYTCNIAEFVGRESCAAHHVAAFLRDIETGLDFLHSLGLAHNDIHGGNICVANGQRAVIVDFDSCTPFGQPMLKGESVVRGDDGQALSAADNDFLGLEDLEHVLWTSVPRGQRATAVRESPQSEIQTRCR